MTTLLFANNATGTLNGPITNTALSLTLSTGQGALFPNPGAGQAFKMTLVDALTQAINEIVLVTARSGDVCTIVRAQEGTTAKNWLGGDLAANLVTAGSLAVLVQQANARTRLAANTNYYVATTGSDSTGDGSIGLPWATLQYAYNWVQANIDLNGFNIVINVADGTYTGNLTVISECVGGGSVTVQGNLTTPASCIINATGACIESRGPAISIGGFKLINSAGVGLYTQAGGGLYITGKMDFGTCSGAHMSTIGAGSFIDISTSYNVTGAAPYHWLADALAQILFNTAVTVTTSGTPNFSTAFAVAQRGGSLIVPSITFAGTGATGVRYTAGLNGVISTNGGGANYIPGNSAGSTATGGQYA